MLYVIFICLSSFFNITNNSAPVVNFEDVDSHARKLNKSATFQKTAEQLVAPFTSESEQARAIFIWLTDNIKYDIKKYKRQQRSPKRERIYADSEAELAIIRKQRQMDLAVKAFKNGRGVCEDYAYLFQFMCEHVGLESAFIPGYGRFSAQTINRVHRGSNHAWNAVKIDGSWYLLDATWASGNTDMSAGKFTKDYKEGLFMTNPERFLLTHFPEDPAWQLLSDQVEKSSFTKLPYGFPELSNTSIIGYFPEFGSVKKKGRTIKLGLHVTDTNRHYVLVNNRNMTEFKAKITNDQVIFDIPTNKIRRGELTIAVVENQKVKPIISYIVN